MKRDLNKLANTEFDLVVIGAGIYGVATVWDASLRGLKVALIEKNDFGSATSSNSLKTIHGGLRYLQQLDFIRMRESIHERAVLMRIAPNLVYPLPVIMPTYSNKMKSRPALMAALIANDIVGFDRNKLSDPHKYMPNGFTMSKKRVPDYIPGYSKYNMNGGAVWYDCQCFNTERLLLSFVISAANQGAEVANYVKAVGLKKDGRKVSAVKVQDSLTGNEFEIKTKFVVNNSGPWVDDVLEKMGTKSVNTKFNLSSAMNLIVKRKLLKNHAAGLSGPWKYIRKDGSEYNAFRMLFFAPWRDYTIIGTNHLPYTGEQDSYKVTEKEITEFLADVNKAYPGADIKRNEVTFFYGGFLPMAKQNPDTGEVGLQKHYKIYDHSDEDQIEGLISIVGVKYTTARDVGKKTTDLVFEKLNKKSPKCQTETTRLYGGEIEKFEEFLKELANKNQGFSDALVSHLGYNYGSAYKDILSYGEINKKWVELMPGSNEVLKAEVIHGIREEMALKLSDIVLRRTDAGTGENPGKEFLETAAQIMGEELGWEEIKRKQEIEEVNQIYIAE